MGYKAWVDDVKCVRFPLDNHSDFQAPVETVGLDEAVLKITQPLTPAEQWRLDYFPPAGEPEWMGDEITNRQKVALLISMDELSSLRESMILAGWGDEWTVSDLYKGQGNRFMTALRGKMEKTEWTVDDVLSALMYERVNG